LESFEAKVDICEKVLGEVSEDEKKTWIIFQEAGSLKSGRSSN
jgi:hypothetical protein